MSSTDRLQSPTRRRLSSWATLVLALLSIGVLLSWVVVLVDALRQATGWELARPLMFLVGALLTSVGVAGSGVAARLAWALPDRSKLMALVATVGLVATLVGGFLTVSSFSFYPTPRAEIDHEHESSVGRSEAVADLLGGIAGGAEDDAP